MNIIHIACAGMLALFTAPYAPAQAPASRMGLQVQIQTQQDRKEIKGSSADTVTQKKVLQITINGAPRSPETRTGKWTVYGRNLKTREITVIESGKFEVQLEANGQQKMETQTVETTSTPDHFVVSSGRKGKAKKMEASGTKYYGFSVILKDGAAAVASIFDPANLGDKAASISSSHQD
jgi:hypothetical protein